MKKIITMILCVATCLSMTTMCNAAFSNAARTSKLFTSYAGYTFNIDDYYNTMKKYAAHGEYKCEWYQASNHKNEYYTLSNCWIDTTGKIHINITTKGTAGSYRGYYSWLGIACNEKGDFNFTYVCNNGTIDYAWNGSYQVGTLTVKYADGETIIEEIDSFDGFDTTYMAEYVAETIRECYWKDCNYDFDGFMF